MDGKRLHCKKIKSTLHASIITCLQNGPYHHLLQHAKQLWASRMNGYMNTVITPYFNMNNVWMFFSNSGWRRRRIRRSRVSSRVTFQTRHTEAGHVRRTWNLDPFQVECSSVLVITEVARYCREELCNRRITYTRVRTSGLLRLVL